MGLGCGGCYLIVDLVGGIAGKGCVKVYDLMNVSCCRVYPNIKIVSDVANPRTGWRSAWEWLE